MKREIINSDYEMRLASLRELQSATGEELCLSPSGVVTVGRVGCIIALCRPF
jgi:hypothetical protein